jgi:hypothetical protein
MNIRFKITTALLAVIRNDLERRHPLAHERVGFIGAGLAAAHDNLLILARSYRPVMDNEYLPDPSVGAMVGADAFRRARQWAMDERMAIFHVHSHGGMGVPGFSSIDNRENAKFIPNFLSIAPQCAHGALVLSDNAAAGQVWLKRGGVPPRIASFSAVGMPLQSWRAV